MTSHDRHRPGAAAAAAGRRSRSSSARPAARRPGGCSRCCCSSSLDLLLAPRPGTGSRSPADRWPGAAGRDHRDGPAGRQPRPAPGARGAARRLAAVRGRDRNRHRLDLAAGDQVRLTTPLTPTRRGDRRADRVTVRCIGPLGLAARQRVAGGARPGARAAAVPLPQAPAQPAGPAARARRPRGGPGPRPGHRVRLPARLRARRRRTQHRLAGQRPLPHRGGADLAARAAAPGAAGPGHLPHVGRAHRRRPPAGLRDGRRAAARGAGRPAPGTASTSWPATGGCGPGSAPAARGDALPQVVEAMADLEPALVEADWSRLSARRSSRSAGSRRWWCC